MAAHRTPQPAGRTPEVSSVTVRSSCGILKDLRLGPGQALGLVNFGLGPGQASGWVFLSELVLVDLRLERGKLGVVSKPTTGLRRRVLYLGLKLESEGPRCRGVRCRSPAGGLRERRPEVLLPPHSNRR